jgi:hypothetical protein
MKMFDASTPPAKAPAGYGAVAGYIGGDTPHVWTRAEWDRFAGLRKLPIWTRSVPAVADPETDAYAALKALHDLGWPRGKSMAIDLEEAEDPNWLTKFWAVVKPDYRLLVYGAESTVYGNPACSGYWVADWTGKLHMDMHRSVKIRKNADRATQYEGAVTAAYDSSDVAGWWARHRLAVKLG